MSNKPSLLSLSLLEPFIERKVRSYREPQRTGTPKGEKVGISRTKYHAAALALTTQFSRKEQAAVLGISYGLLRKWHTEDGFFEKKDELARDFAHAFLREFTRREQSQNQKFDRFFKKSIDYIQKNSLPVLQSSDLVQEAKFLSDLVWDHIWEKMLLDRKKTKDDDDSEFLSRLFDLYVFRPLPSFHEKKIAERQKRIAGYTLDLAFAILKKEELSVHDRKVLLVILKQNIQSYKGE